MQRYLPRFCLEAFVDPRESTLGRPAVWVHRPAIGVFQPAPVDPQGARWHFNYVDEPALRKNDDLEPLLASLENDAERLVAEIPARSGIAAEGREVLSRFLALLGIRLSARFGDLDEAEARRGYEELFPVLGDMGWVFWEAEPPDYFVSSNAPFHVAFPKDDGLVQGMELYAPGVEITLPLTPRIALHATWKRRGEVWRRATEEVLLELNARTMLRARKFVIAPKPAIPG